MTVRTAIPRANCRWDGKPIIWIWDKWQHVNSQDQKECHYSVPFTDELAAMRESGSHV